MSNPTMLFDLISPTLILVVHDDRAPSTEEWRAYLALMATMEDPVRVLACSAAGGPNAVQRGELEAVLGGRPSTAAVVTSSRVARGIVTAISWFRGGIRAFSPAEIGEGLAYLEVPEAHRAPVIDQVRGFVGDLGIGQAFDL